MGLPSPLFRREARRQSRAARCGPQRKRLPSPPRLLGSPPCLPVLPPSLFLGSPPALELETLVFPAVALPEILVASACVSPVLTVAERFSPAFAGFFSASFGRLVSCFDASSRGVLCQLRQLTTPASTVAAASAHPRATAVRWTLSVTCCVRNSCRKRISTRAGACARAVSTANARNSTLAACQESCSAAHREQVLG